MIFTALWSTVHDLRSQEKLLVYDTPVAIPVKKIV